MKVQREDIFEVKELFYTDLTVRVAVMENGNLLFSARDLATALGVVNPFNLTKSVDNRSKAEIVLSFDGTNAQRYIFVNLDGLMCMVYRARKSEVNRLDFITWAKRQGVN